MTKLDFQDKAVTQLIEKFKRLWNAEGTMLPLVFKSPTGSGKTFMTESFMQELKTVGGFTDDIAWIWITFSDELAMQSRSKFEEYFYPNVGRRLLTVADFADGILKRDDVLFLNWQKLVANDADARILRRPDNKAKKKESGYYFEDIIEATHAEGRTIAMVIDESHKNVSELAESVVIRPANPKVIIKVSATPKTVPTTEDIEDGKADFVRVKREDVVKAGLVKEAVVSQTKEEIEAGSDEKDLDAKLLDLAIKKRDALRSEWENTGSNVHPLILVQLPDEKKDAGSTEKIKKEIVWDYLKKRGVAEENIANWFDGDKEHDKLKFIAEADSPIEFLLFKQAAGTGWDCPRAQILVMYRDIKSPIFKTQTLGRIIRNPEPKMDLSTHPALRKGYLYTNYSSAEVKKGSENDQDNPILMKKAALQLKIPDGAETVSVNDAMTTEFVSRADYGDLGKASEFQECFMGAMDGYFAISSDDFGHDRSGKVEAKGVGLSQSFKKSIVTGLVVKSVDENGDNGSDLDDEVSANDAERLFVAKCREMLEGQTDEETRVGNIARSESIFRMGVRNWLKEALPDVASESGRYKIFLNDAMKGAGSIMLDAITSALKAYTPVRRKLVAERKKKIMEIPPTVFLLKREYEYPDGYEEYLDADGNAPKLSVVKPFYLRKAYPGRENETNFVAFLEGNGTKIEWWLKNGDDGKDWFGLKYVSTASKDERLFYPDWIVKFKDGRIGIFDTKGGRTATDPEGKEVGLRDKIIAMNKAAGADTFWGGLVVFENGMWYWHDGTNYSYAPGKLDGWKQLKF